MVSGRSATRTTQHFSSQDHFIGKIKTTRPLRIREYRESIRLRTPGRSRLASLTGSGTDAPQATRPRWDRDPNFSLSTNTCVPTPRHGPKQTQPTPHRAQTRSLVNREWWQWQLARQSPCPCRVPLASRLWGLRPGGGRVRAEGPPEEGRRQRPAQEGLPAAQAKPQLSMGSLDRDRDTKGSLPGDHAHSQYLLQGERLEVHAAASCNQHTQDSSVFGKMRQRHTHT